MILSRKKKRVDVDAEDLGEDLSEMDNNLPYDDPIEEEPPKRRYTDSFDNPDNFNDEMGSPAIDPDNLRYLQENAPEIFNFITLLQGKIKNKSGKYVRVKNIKPIMNDIGVYKIYQVLTGTLMKVISLGNIDAEEARKRTLSISLGLIENMAQNKELYEIDLSDMSLVIRQVENLVYLQFTRPVNSNERKFLGKIWNYDEDVKVDDAKQDKQRASFFG